MPLTTRRVLLAAAVAIAVPASPASAAAVCREIRCVELMPAHNLLSNAIGQPPIGTGGGGGGVLCVYTKLSGSPPEGWGGDPNDTPPYVFVETEAWGAQHPDDWDFQSCVPACPPAPGPPGGELDAVITAVTDPGSPGDVVAAATCAIGG